MMRALLVIDWALLAFLSGRAVHDSVLCSLILFCSALFVAYFGAKHWSRL